MQKFTLTYFGIFVNYGGILKNHLGAQNLWIQLFSHSFDDSNTLQEKELWEMNAFEKLEAAAKKKEEGNRLFKIGNYWRASKKYERVCLSTISLDKPLG